MSSSTSLFQVYLRLRPPIQSAAKDRSDPWLIIEQPSNEENQQSEKESESMSHPTHVTLQPPNESRKRAIERFGFTKIFKEQASQLEIFQEIKVAENVKSVLQTGRDGLIATLGVTGSGKVRYQ
jgi:Tfp pilus assembly pilus retraction ATPase PilT